jgi:drug/metabolite transporter (DMT)-like permease
MQQTMSLATIFGLCCFSFMMAAGQILFKQTAQQAQAMSSLRDILCLFTLPSFWAAVFLYGLATLLWIKIIQVVPLSRAYPFAALGFVIVPLAAMFFFKETLTLRYAIGAGFIVVGILVSMQS